MQTNAWGLTTLPSRSGRMYPWVGSIDLTNIVKLTIIIDQDYRSWFWIVCNQVGKCNSHLITPIWHSTSGYLQDGAPVGWPSLVTRLVTPIYDEVCHLTSVVVTYWATIQRQCVQMWPDHFKSSPVPKTAATNREFQGWDLNVKRLFIANGNRESISSHYLIVIRSRTLEDPWRECTTSSDYHPRQSTADQPIFTSNGFHCSDLNIPNNVDPTVKAVQDLGIAYLGKWIQDWRQQHPGVPSASNFSTPDPNTLPKPPVFKPTHIPQSIISAPPPRLPSSINPSAPGRNGPANGPKAHVTPNAWAKSFGHSAWSSIGNDS